VASRRLADALSKLAGRTRPPATRPAVFVTPLKVVLDQLKNSLQAPVSLEDAAGQPGRGLKGRTA
jgi:hypothetical protein